MKFINKKRLLPVAAILILTCMTGCTPKEVHPVTEYELTQYNRSLNKGELFAAPLCVTSENVEPENISLSESLHAAALFGAEQKEVFYAKQIHDRLAPASTTKLLTLYLALKYGELSDEVTVSKTAASVPSDSSVAGLQEGDVLTLEDLMYGLMLPSGNDSAVAIAEHISGNVDAFVELMNEEANTLGATNSHFVNPHGYHDDNHYTTAYDLYLIANQCMANQTALDIVASPSYSTTIHNRNGSSREVTWKQSNQFVNGTRTVPENVYVVGGKTGTTNEAGACLVLISRDTDSRPYISIVMGAASKPLLYDTMTSLLSAIPALS